MEENKKILAPVIVFVYARPEHTKSMLESLEKNILAEKTDLYIFSDSAKKENVIEKVKEVRKIIYNIEKQGKFKQVKIIESKENKGLAKSVIEGVTQIINEYGKAIVVEDDLILSKTFLQYMNEALDFYERNDKIWSISGYNLPIEIPREYDEEVYLSYRGCSWGWATWKDRWNCVDWKVKDYNVFKNNKKKRRHFNLGGLDLAQMLDAQMQGKIDSWAIRWCYEQSKRNMYTIYPVKSLIINKGLDGSGTHSGTTEKFDVEYYEKIPKLEKNLELNKKIIKRFRKKFDYGIRQKLYEILMYLKMEKVIKLIKELKYGTK